MLSGLDGGSLDTDANDGEKEQQSDGSGLGFDPVSGLFQGIQGLGDGVVKGAKGVGDGLVGGVKTVSGSVVKGAQVLGDGAKGAVVGVGSGVVGGVKTVGSGVVAVGNGVGQGVVQVGGALGSGVVSSAAAVGDVVDSTARGVGDGVAAVGSGVVSGARGVGDGVVYVGAGAVGGVVAVGEGVVGGVKTVGGGLASGVKTVGEGAVGGVAAIGGGIASGAKSVGEGVAAVGSGVAGATGFTAANRERSESEVSWRTTDLHRYMQSDEAEEARAREQKRNETIADGLLAVVWEVAWWLLRGFIGYFVRAMVYVFLQSRQWSGARTKHESPLLASIVNHVLLEFWPLIREATELSCRTTALRLVNEQLSRMKSPVVDKMLTFEVDIGKRPIQVKSASLVPSYTYREGDMTASFLDLDLALDLEGDSVALSGDFTLAGDVSQTPIGVKIKNLNFSKEQLRVKLGPLQSSLPCFRALQVGFARTPELEMDWEVSSRTTMVNEIYKGVAATTGGILSHAIADFLQNKVLLSLVNNFAVWPNKVVVPTTTWAYMFVGYVPEQPPPIKHDELSFPPIGHVLVSVVEARDLVQNSISESDSYVRVRVGGAELRTETCYNTSNPVWLKEWRPTSNEDADTKGSVLGDLVSGLNPFNGIKLFGSKGRSDWSPNLQAIEPSGSFSRPPRSPRSPRGNRRKSDYALTSSGGSNTDRDADGPLPFGLGSTVNGLFRHGDERPISPLTPPTPTDVHSASSEAPGISSMGRMRKVPEDYSGAADSNEDERWRHRDLNETLSPSQPPRTLGGTQTFTWKLPPSRHTVVGRDAKRHYNEPVEPSPAERRRAVRARRAAEVSVIPNLREHAPAREAPGLEQDDGGAELDQRQKILQNTRRETNGGGAHAAGSVAGHEAGSSTRAPSTDTTGGMPATTEADEDEEGRARSAVDTVAPMGSVLPRMSSCNLDRWSSSDVGGSPRGAGDTRIGRDREAFETPHFERLRSSDLASETAPKDTSMVRSYHTQYESGEADARGGGRASSANREGDCPRTPPRKRSNRRGGSMSSGMMSPTSTETWSHDHAPHTSVPKVMFKIPVKESSQSLEFEVWDDETENVGNVGDFKAFEDVMLGKGEMVIDEMEPFRVYDCWLDLDISMGEKKLNIIKGLRNTLLNSKHESRLRVKVEWRPGLFDSSKKASAATGKVLEHGQHGFFHHTNTVFLALVAAFAPSFTTLLFLRNVSAQSPVASFMFLFVQASVLSAIFFGPVLCGFLIYSQVDNVPPAEPWPDSVLKSYAEAKAKASGEKTSMPSPTSHRPRRGSQYTPASVSSEPAPVETERLLRAGTGADGAARNASPEDVAMASVADIGASTSAISSSSLPPSNAISRDDGVPHHEAQAPAERGAELRLRRRASGA